MQHNSTRTKIKNFFVHILSCCDRADPPLQIGYPTDFRREDIKIDGLTDQEQAFIREKAIADAARMFTDAPRTRVTHPSFPNYPIPSPHSCPTFPHSSSPLPAHQRCMSRVRGHARKLSAKLCGGYQGVAAHELEEQGGLMDGELDVAATSQERLGLGISKTLFADPFAMSRDSVTLAGGSEGDSINKEMLARA